MFFLLTIFFTFAIVWGIKISTSNGNVFEKIKDFLEKNLSEKLFKWVVDCPYCMPSLYSIFGYVFYYIYIGYIDWGRLFFYPIIVGASSFVCGILWVINETINEKKKHIENLNYELDKQYS